MTFLSALLHGTHRVQTREAAKRFSGDDGPLADCHGFSIDAGRFSLNMGHVLMVRRLPAPVSAGLLLAALLPLAACGGGSKERPKADLAASKVTTIGVNSYLWRATLDTLSFMPMVQTDSNGGVIVTDWYANPNTPNERMKLTVSILDQDLRADALRVAASRQVNQGGQWVDAPVQAATVQKLEEIILTKARDLRRMAIAG